MRLRHRAQAFFWEHNLPIRGLGRAIKKLASVTAYRLRRLLNRDLPPRVVSIAAETAIPPLKNHAITVLTGEEHSPTEATALLGSQTETSVEVNPRGALRTRYCFLTDRGFGSLPPTYLESLLIAAAAENLGWVAGGWSAPAVGRFGPSGRIWRDADSSPGANMLFRVPGSDRRPGTGVLGRTVAHIRDKSRLARCVPLEQPLTIQSGPYRLCPIHSAGAIYGQPVFDVEQVLSGMREVDGPPTVIFLLPFLAVGGAERLLRDLVGSMRTRSRVLVVTTDPHLDHLGQTVDTFRKLTPHVYTLGDWIPQQALASAVRHLVRRWKVKTLMCWNGNVLFFDLVSDLKRRFPSLRIINQLFNHEGGWIEHYCPSVIDAVDCHVAVNTQVERALTEHRSVPRNKVVTIFHGIEVPEPVALEDAGRRRREIREKLGIPPDVVLVGTFIRLHPQKRPLDVIRVARKLSSTGIHFLLVGGGPMERDIESEIGRRPLQNLTRLPLLPDPQQLYDAIDICLMTSSFEGLPVFLLDGLARGIPCVATAVGDIPLLLGAGGGFTVDTPGDIDGLADQIRRLSEDGELRRTQGKLGRARVASEFNLATFVSAYEAAIFPTR